MANDRLRDALMTARVTPEELADELGVHTETVERWITQDRNPYPQFRHRRYDGFHFLPDLSGFRPGFHPEG